MEDVITAFAALHAHTSFNHFQYHISCKIMHTWLYP